MKKILKALGILLLALILLVGGFIGYLSVTEYHPQSVEDAVGTVGSTPFRDGQSLTILSWNIGYAGLDKDADFFMDGGTSVYPVSQDHVTENLRAIDTYIHEAGTDLVILQEVDRDSTRTGHVDEYELLLHDFDGAYAPNYRCAYVPYPLPPIGKVESGLAIYSVTGSPAVQPQRVALPCPFSWPVSMANLKRCLLVTRYEITDEAGNATEKQLVVVNLHLEAYDDGEGKLAQTAALMSLLQEEYSKGNYVIAGGDWNQTFPGGLDNFPMQGSDLWTPGTLDGSALPEGWRYAVDTGTATCRSLDRALDAEDPTMQYYVIDGFLLSPNVTLTSVETQDLGFANSDHNPVRLEVVLGN